MKQNVITMVALIASNAMFLKVQYELTLIKCDHTKGSPINNVLAIKEKGINDLWRQYIEANGGSESRIMWRH